LTELKIDKEKNCKGEAGVSETAPVIRKKEKTDACKKIDVSGSSCIWSDFKRGLKVNKRGEPRRERIPERSLLYGKKKGDPQTKIRKPGGAQGGGVGGSQRLRKKNGRTDVVE